MKVSGKKTYTEDVTIEVSQSEVDKIIESATSSKLVGILRKRLVKKFAEDLEPRKPVNTVREVFWAKTDVKGPVDSGMYLTLVEEDGYYNPRERCYEDKHVRRLTDDEVDEFTELLNFPGPLGIYLI